MENYLAKENTNIYESKALENNASYLSMTGGKDSYVGQVSQISGETKVLSSVDSNHDYLSAFRSFLGGFLSVILIISITSFLLVKLIKGKKNPLLLPR